MFQMFVRSLIPLLSQDEYLNSSEASDNTQVLENILYGVTSLVIILVIILIYVSVKTRLSQNRFKLLDNSGERRENVEIDCVHLAICNQQQHSWNAAH